jgi:peptidoglycan-associated lipoprotein
MGTKLEFTMKKTITLCIALLSILNCGCQRTSREMWEDTKSSGRYFSRGFRSLLGGHEDMNYAYQPTWSQDAEFIPLTSEENEGKPIVYDSVPLAKESPGDPGSSVPGIEGFDSPKGKLAQLFSNIHFKLDQFEIHGEQNLQTLHQIARHLEKNPSTYLFIEGHADERGAAAYNLALGSRRANAIRAYLISQGVNPDQLFTISYGKERPIVQGHNEDSWGKNRRGQFKIHAR